MKSGTVPAMIVRFYLYGSGLPPARTLWESWMEGADCAIADAYAIGAPATMHAAFRPRYAATGLPSRFTKGGLSMRVRCEIWLAAVALCFAMPALAASSTGYGKGGRTKDFAVDVQKHDQSGESFRITGHCQSACTMFLAVRNVCIEPSARLLFHAGDNAAATSRMMNSYNSRLRAYLVANRAMETPAFHTISGSDMIGKFGYKACR